MGEKMRVLVACEFSGIVRDAFKEKGHDTCLWLKNLSKLIPTYIVDGREGRVHKEPPSPDRWKNRSRTLQGIADAMADQWGMR
jgi:hypothetical protein